ncbi:MAG: hypothetical protein RJA70_4347 [Pseudomonadota bacterium]|jgi:HAD superfamily 5'-nucleotidase-like hydrolase
MVESVKATSPLDEMELPPLQRRVFCNRTLNMRSIEAVGCDMDYTLVHYNTERWELGAFEHAKQQLLDKGWPVRDLVFQPELACLGLVIDVELGNVVKANRFGHVRRAYHGTTPLTFAERRAEYTTAPVDLSDSRWEFMNTLFSLSEACLFMKLVELLDAGKLDGLINAHAMTYRELYKQVKEALDATHIEGKLKAQIMANPEEYVVLDPDLPLALQDLRGAGKKLMLITNSEWIYTRAMMSYAFDRYLPAGTTWRDLFDIVVVQARKPAFFSSRNPVFKLVNEEGLLEPYIGKLEIGGIYLGGDARLIEKSLGVQADDILYIGDHIFADVHVSKDLLRWRTALVVRELEEELEEMVQFHAQQLQLEQWMTQKALWEHQFSQIRLVLQRKKRGYGPELDVDVAALRAQMQALRTQLVALDEQIAPLAKISGELFNAGWGPLMRCGSDKSHLARQIERYADIYTSRVSNLLRYTPFVYLRAPRGTLPHDTDLINIEALSGLVEPVEGAYLTADVP